jgi:thioredoxin reductase (NADPH)
LHNTDVAIIGAGPIGLFMSFQAGMLGMKSAIFDALAFPGGQCSALYPEKPIYDIPAFKTILSQDLIDNLMEQALQFSPHLVLGSPVVELRSEGSEFIVTNANKNSVKAKAVVIAAGSGEFQFKKPPISNIELYENKTIFYSIQQTKLFHDKVLTICGGGDSAVDWAIELANNAQHIHLIHRREKFRCLDATYNKLMQLVDSGKITMHIPFQLYDVIGVDGIINQVMIANLEGALKTIDTDFLLPFYGLATNLDRIIDWGIDMDHNAIVTDQSTMMTNYPGVFAIGDVAFYHGKLKLILTGFAEAAIAAQNIYHLVFPGQALHFEHSTTKGVRHFGS